MLVDLVAVPADHVAELLALEAPRGDRQVTQLLEDRAEAITLAVGSAVPGDCIVIAGKGHETYQIVEGERLPFSDEDQARDAIQRRAKS